MKTEVYLLPELDCPNCAMKVERQIGKIKGLSQVSVNFMQKKMTVSYEGESRREEILRTLKQIEPDIRPIEVSGAGRMASSGEDDGQQQKHCGCGHDHDHASSCSSGCDHDHHDHHEHHSCTCAHDHHDEKETAAAGVRPQAQGEVRLRLAGLDCAQCAAKIERAVSELPQVKAASVTFSTELLAVDLQPGQDRETLIRSVRELVGRLEPQVQVVLAEDREASAEKPRSFLKDNARLIVGALVFAVGIAVEHQSWAVVIFLISFVLIGGDVVVSAVRNVLHGEWFDETFLMSVATIGAFAISDYTEGVAVMLFYQIGEVLQSIAVDRSRRSISSLMNIRADTATLLQQGQERIVDPQQVRVNDLILVRAGERVPLDGVIEEGTSSLDTSALTGESLPRDVGAGDEILAGMVNLNGVLRIRVSREYGESTVARILELVENASSKKAPIERFITRFARVYTPVVVIAAVLVAVIPPLLNLGSLQVWVYRALTFLVVSCPCALVISIPLGLFAGIGGASRRGILVKGGNDLEILKDVDTVVFDKTGTLTQGVFTVTEICPVRIEQRQLLELAALGESFSNHPIARSIVSAYGQPIDRQRVSDVHEIPGQGLRVCIDGRPVVLGNEKLMRSCGYKIASTSAAGTLVHVAVDEAYAGYLVIADQIKPTSAPAIRQLKQQGVRRTVMLTGDRESAARAVAQQIGVDTVVAQLLPQDKVEQVEKLMQQQAAGKKLAFVGDGINDAPVLARADLGVAMGGMGSDAAIEAADIILMKDDPAALAQAIRISRKTHRILVQNIVFSLAVKIGVLILTVFGMSNMGMGVFADVGVMLLAILNSMRALSLR